MNNIAVNEFIMSTHASVRLQQRGITTETLNLVLQYGRWFYAGSSDYAIVIDNKTHDVLPRSLKGSHTRNTAIIMSQEGVIVTVEHLRKGIPRHWIPIGHQRKTKTHKRERFSGCLPFIVVNFHITQKCNYCCQHCFARFEDNSCASSIFRSPESTVMLMQIVFNHFREQGVKTIRMNFAGGEPLLEKNLSNYINRASQIGFEVSLITNGSLLTPVFLKECGRNIAKLGLSIDSFQRDTNCAIGRCTPHGQVLNFTQYQHRISQYRHERSNGRVKINTVVNSMNKEEILSDDIIRLHPDEWKVFKVLPVHSGIDLISEADFLNFCNQNSRARNLMRAETNEEMTESYLMIDPSGRFFQNSEHSHAGYKYSEDILKIGVSRALSQVHFDAEKFRNRY
ncbi:MAG: viperin family antiviral radical SAM protein [Proteobacteria bacterium]|nr:viperin family antiviral radical SAM protein [Pseudomonadota bacterium]